MNNLPRVIQRTAVLLITYGIAGLAYIFWTIRGSYGAMLLAIDGLIFILVILVGAIGSLIAGCILMMKNKLIVKNEKTMMFFIAPPAILVAYDTLSFFVGPRQNIYIDISILGLIIYNIILYRHLRTTTNILKQQAK